MWSTTYSGFAACMSSGGRACQEAAGDDLVTTSCLSRDRRDYVVRQRRHGHLRLDRFPRRRAASVVLLHCTGLHTLGYDRVLARDLVLPRADWVRVSVYPFRAGEYGRADR